MHVMLGLFCMKHHCIFYFLISFYLVYIYVHPPTIIKHV